MKMQGIRVCCMHFHGEQRITWIGPARFATAVHAGSATIFGWLRHKEGSSRHSDLFLATQTGLGGATLQLRQVQPCNSDRAGGCNLATQTGLGGATLQLRQGWGVQPCNSDRCNLATQTGLGGATLQLRQGWGVQPCPSPSAAVYKHVNLLCATALAKQLTKQLTVYQWARHEKLLDVWFFRTASLNIIIFLEVNFSKCVLSRNSFRKHPLCIGHWQQTGINQLHQWLQHWNETLCSSCGYGLASPQHAPGVPPTHVAAHVEARHLRAVTRACKRAFQMVQN